MVYFSFTYQSNVSCRVLLRVPGCFSVLIMSSAAHGLVQLSLDPSGSAGKKPTCWCRRHKRQEFDTWVRKIPWRRKLQPTPVFLPEKFHEQRSLTECTHAHTHKPRPVILKLISGSLYSLREICSCGLKLATFTIFEIETEI